MRKHLMTILLVFFLSCNPIFGYQILYQDQKNETFHEGLEYLELRRFTDEGWVDVHVIKADLSDPNLSLMPLYDQTGISSRATITAMLEAQKGTVGINGDFFYRADGYAPLGATISNGQLITSPAHMEKNLPTILVDAQKNVSFPVIPWEISIFHGMETTKAYSYNKATTEYSVPRIFTDQFSGKTLGNKVPLLEIVVQQDQVTQIYTNAPATPLAPGSQLIAVDLNHAPPSLLALRPGDYVHIQVQIDPDFLNAQAVVGGGAYLLKDGRIQDFAINIEGKHPRSAVGIDASGRTLFLVAVNGRGNTFRGLEQGEFAALLQELGVYHAINFDGGGSTTLAVKNPFDGKYEVLNTPSDGTPRKVINGLGLKYEADLGPLMKLHCQSDDDNIFLNTGRSLSFYGTDAMGNVLFIPPSEISMQLLSGDALFQDGRIIPNKEGRLSVSFGYQNLSAISNFNVLSPASALDFPLDMLQFDTGLIADLYEVFGNVTGMNNEGYSAHIEQKDLQIKAFGPIGTLSQGLLATAPKNAFGGISVSSFGAVKNLMVQVGYEEFLLDGLDNLSNKMPASYPENVGTTLFISPDRKEGKASIRLSYDFTVTDKTRGAYLAFQEPLVISSPIFGLAVDVYANGYGHWLRAKLEDGNGKIQVVDFNKNLDYVGFHTEKAMLPSDIKYPVKIHRIYIAETNPSTQNVGSILLDNLRTLKNPAIGAVSLPPETTAKDPLQNLTEQGMHTFVFSPGPSDWNTLFARHLGHSIYENSRYVFSKTPLPARATSEMKAKFQPLSGRGEGLNLEGVSILKYQSERGLRRKDPNQWRHLLSSLEQSDAPLILYIDGPLFGKAGFIDPLERQLLEKQLERYATTKAPVLVILNGEVYRTKVRNQVRYITLPLDEPVLLKNFESKKKLVIQWGEDQRFHYDFVDIFKP